MIIITLSRVTGILAIAGIIAFRSGSAASTNISSVEFDHGATGKKHADCAKKCIISGLPVGLKADDGKTYLLIGEHVPLNAEVAQHAAKKITVEGKVVSRDGINMIENAVVQK